MLDFVGHLDFTPFGDRCVRILDNNLFLDLRELPPQLAATAVGLTRTMDLLAAHRAEEARRKLEEAGILDLLASIAPARPAGALAPDYGDLWSLYQLVRDKAPRRVLEFGSGWSTYIIARALRDNGAGFLTSVDCDRSWTAVTRDGLPPDLAEWCRIVHSATRIGKCRGHAVLRHKVVPEPAPDFIYLDGPVLYQGLWIAADVNDLESAMPRRSTIVVDGRRDNVLFLARTLDRSYRIRSEGVSVLLDDAFYETLFSSVFEEIGDR